MRIFFRSIKVRLTFVTVAFSLIVIVVMVLVSLFQLQQVIRTNMLQSVEFNLHLTAQIIHEEIRALDNLRSTASIHPRTIAFLSEPEYSTRLAIALQEGLTEDMTYNPSVRHLRRLFVTDRDLTRWVQTGLFSDRLLMTAENISLLGEFSEAGSSQWTGIEPDPFAYVGTEPIFSMISPVYQRRGTAVIGYVYIAVSSNAILRPLLGYSFFEQGDLFVKMGESSFMVVDGKFVEAHLELYDAQPSGDAPLNSATEILTFEDGQGRRCLAVISPIGQTGITLMQTLPTQLVMQESYFVIRLFLLICLGVFILGVVVALYLSWSINRPVKQIGKQVNAIAGGNFTPNPDIEWDNELGEIGRGVNQLAGDVEALIKSRLESEKRKRDLEYKMLQSQVNPHFLYNALNSIKWMATIQKADGIAEMTTSLSRLLKCVAKIKKTLVSLSQEITLLEDYFVIARYRYGGMLSSRFDIPKTLLDCSIPVFTLQPIAENAIFHGIEANGGIGIVTVTAAVAGGDLEIAIEDDGVGMDDDTIRKLFETDATENHALFREVGISNVHARIQHEFGANYGLRIESKQGEFTRVIVRLPYEKIEEESSV